MNGTLEKYEPNYFGESAKLLKTVNGYYSFNLPWYKAAMSNLSLFQITDPYVFGENRAGISSTIVLFADLQPPPFAPAFTPLVAPNGPIPRNRTVLGVFASQISLFEISLTLSRTLPSNGSEAYIFSSRSGDLIGYRWFEKDVFVFFLLLISLKKQRIIFWNGGFACSKSDGFRKPCRASNSAIHVRSKRNFSLQLQVKK